MAVTQYWDGSAADNAYVTPANWSLMGGGAGAKPLSTDSQVFPAMAASSTKDLAGSDQSLVLIVETVIEHGCYLNFGSYLVPWILDTDYLVYRGLASAFFDVRNSTEIRIEESAPAASGNAYGVYLKGNGTNALLIIDCGNGNSVGVASLGDHTMTATAVEIASGTVDLGDGLACTTLTVSGGAVESKADITTVTVTAGTMRQLKNNPTTLNAHGGRFYYSSESAPTTLNLYPGGVIDMSEDTRAKDWSAVAINDYGGQIYDPGLVLGTLTLTRKRGGTVRGS